MEFASFKEAETFKGNTNITYEYKIADKDINFCISEINGRLPETRRCVNRVCKEMAHVLEGKGIIEVEGKKYNLKRDDVILISPGERYYFEGNLKLALPCTPAWSPEQHEIVD